MRRLNHNEPGLRRRSLRNGFSLVELLIVVIILSVFAAVTLTQWQPNVYDQLRSAAQVVVADIAHARNLAVANNSSYQLTFDLTANQYVLAHSGSVSGLDTLPTSTYGLPTDTPFQRTTDLVALPAIAPIELVAVHRLLPAAEDVVDVEFGPLGETTRSEPTRIWLATALSDARRYLPIDIDPVTGLAVIGELQVDSPVTPESASE